MDLPFYLGCSRAGNRWSLAAEKESHQNEPGMMQKWFLEGTEVVSLSCGLVVSAINFHFEDPWFDPHLWPTFFDLFFEHLMGKLTSLRSQSLRYWSIGDVVCSYRYAMLWHSSLAYNTPAPRLVLWQGEGGGIPPSPCDLLRN